MSERNIAHARALSDTANGPMETSKSVCRSYSADQLPWEQTGFGFTTVRHCLVSEGITAHARVLSDKQHTVSDGDVFLSYCSADQLPWEQTDFHVTVGQCFVSERNIAHARVLSDKQDTVR